MVAAENFWASLASQLGGNRVQVTSVVTDPNADPHEYETNTEDARAFATAKLVILNGAGYDAWGDRLLAASPATGRRVLDVAALLGKKPGDNPHFWYDPAYVLRVADRITAEYRTLEPRDAAYFTQQRSALSRALGPYEQRLAEIKRRFAGTPVGSTESIFAYLARYLGLRLVSPPQFMKAVSEGSDPPVGAVIAFQDQIAHGAIKVLVYNVQTATSMTTNLKAQATRAAIPVVGISETMEPVTGTFQQWQLSQLIRLEDALTSSAASR